MPSHRAGRAAHSRRPVARSATTVEDMFAALRNHGPASGLDHTVPNPPRYSPINGALAAPCAHAGGLLTSTQSTSSWVSDLRHTPRHWATGSSAPCTSLFKPVSVKGPVDLGPAPENTFDPSTIWWRHERLHRAVMRHPSALLSRYGAERDAMEAAWVADPPDSSSAFEAADDAETRWLSTVNDAIASRSAPDQRPWLVRHLWHRWNAEAGLRS